MNGLLRTIPTDGYSSKNHRDIEFLFGNFLKLYFRTTKTPENDTLLAISFLTSVGWQQELPVLVGKDHFISRIYRMRLIEYHLCNWIRLQALSHEISIEMILMGFAICTRDSFIDGMEAWEMYQRLRKEMPWIENVKKSRFLLYYVLFRTRHIEFKDYVFYGIVLESFGMFQFTHVLSCKKEFHLQIILGLMSNANNWR